MAERPIKVGKQQIEQRRRTNQVRISDRETKLRDRPRIENTKKIVKQRKG